MKRDRAFDEIWAVKKKIEFFSLTSKMVVLSFSLFSPTSSGCKKLEEEEEKGFFFLALLYKGLRGLKFWVLNLGLPHEEKKPNKCLSQN